MITSALPEFASGARIEFFEEVDSTSLQARRFFDDGDRGPVWVMTAKQTAGYGRRGTAWSHDTGNLAATFLFVPQIEQTRMPQLSFVAALALRDAMAGFIGKGDIALKWPNDVLVDGRKIAGLLLELFGTGSDLAVALGCGVNIASHPDRMDYPSCSLLEFASGSIEPRAFLKILDSHFARLKELWVTKGFEPIRLAWLEHAYNLNKEMTIRLKENETNGVFRDISSSGALILETQDGIQEFSGGAVLYQGGR